MVTSGPTSPTVISLRRVRRRTSNERATPVAQERNPTAPRGPNADTPISFSRAPRLGRCHWSADRPEDGLGRQIRRRLAVKWLILESLFSILALFAILRALWTGWSFLTWWFQDSRRAPSLDFSYSCDPISDGYRIATVSKPSNASFGHSTEWCQSWPDSLLSFFLSTRSGSRRTTSLTKLFGEPSFASRLPVHPRSGWTSRSSRRSQAGIRNNYRQIGNQSGTAGRSRKAFAPRCSCWASFFFVYR